MKLIIGEGRTILKSITVELTEDNTRYVLHALRTFKEKCQRIIQNENRTEDDEFFYANDIMHVALVQKEIKEMAVSTFGKQILNCGHETLKSPISYVLAEVRQDQGEMKSITVELTDGDTNHLLHAVRELEAEYQHIVNGKMSDKEDQAFYTHDLMQAKLVHDKIRKLAIDTFGYDILNFSHELLSDLL